MPSATGAFGQFVAAKEGVLREALQRPLQKRDTRNDASSLPLPETHKLKVEVIEATDLLAYDRGGTSDPLVRCQLFLKQCASLKPLQPILATKEVPKTLAPTWGETLEFEFVDGAAVLRCTVLDKDMLGTDLMGIVEVDLSVLARAEAQLDQQHQLLYHVHRVIRVDVSRPHPRLPLRDQLQPSS